MYIIDRRLNDPGKSLPNRQRFLRRAKAVIQRAVADSAAERNITDIDAPAEVSIPRGGVSEPRFSRVDSGGRRDIVLPGNKKFVEGDLLERPPGGAGAGRDGADSGDGEDEFRFMLTRDEFLQLFLDDLDLPNLVKRRLAEVESSTLRRAGYATTGSPANLALNRTMRNALSRRIALKRPNADDLEALEEELREQEALPQPDPERIELLREALERARGRSLRIPYIDPIDLRYRRFEPIPRPVSQAVMFCLMDVSGSMTEHMKDLAKRFYMLLYVFLTRRYSHVEIVFIRHTHEAKEVDEETFFTSPETGGTLVSSAFVEMDRIVSQRYPPENWNIYAAQASDGDNSMADRANCANLLRWKILPVCQYFAYLEVGAEEEASRMGFGPHASALWQTYEALVRAGSEIAMRKVSSRKEIFPVFRDLFRRREPTEARLP